MIILAIVVVILIVIGIGIVAILMLDAVVSMLEDETNRDD